MALTTAMFYVMSREVCGWSFAKAAVVSWSFLIVDLTFLVANALKTGHGGLHVRQRRWDTPGAGAESHPQQGAAREDRLPHRDHRRRAARRWRAARHSEAQRERVSQRRGAVWLHAGSGHQ